MVMMMTLVGLCSKPRGPLQVVLSSGKQQCVLSAGRASDGRDEVWT